MVTGLEQAALFRKQPGAQRTPFYFSIDEFQDFCANEGTDKTLAQILSECRKFGLHMTLAHQTLAQLSERMKGALGNIQLKVIFGVPREDAEILARQVFQVNGSDIKHQVPDTDQRSRSHPVFYSLMEEIGTVRAEDSKSARPLCLPQTARKERCTADSHGYDPLLPADRPRFW